MVPYIICKDEENEMVSNLKIGFRERQRKCLSKSIAINPSPLKKACSTPDLDPLSKPILSIITTIVILGPDEKPFFVDNIFYHEMRKPFVTSGNISEDLFECPNPSHFHPKLAYVPSQEEVSELLSRIPFFTERESLVQDMRMLFSAMQQILVEVNEDPSQSFMAQLPVWYFRHYHCLHNSYEGLHSF